MSSMIQFKPARPRRRISALERLTTAFTRSHHQHAAPIVGCYLCLHNVSRDASELSAAA